MDFTGSLSPLTRTSRRRTSRRCAVRRRAGFTFVELLLGMVITAMVLSALAAFCASLAKSIGDSDDSQSLFLTANQAALRVQNMVRSARCFGLVRAGSTTGATSPHAGFLIWKNDDGQNPGCIDYEELAWVEQNPAYQPDPIGSPATVIPNALVLYECPPVSQMTAGQLATLSALDSRSSTNAARLDYNAITSSSTPETFKGLSVVKSRLLARGVTAGAFAARLPLSSTEVPSLEFTLIFQRNGYTEVKYASAAIRSPIIQPN